MGHDGSTGRFAGVELTPVASGLEFPEGPVAMDDGSIVLTEIAAGVVRRVRPDGTTSVVADCGGGPNGLAVGPDGALFVCNNGSYFDFVDHDGLVVPHAGSTGWTQGSIQRVDPVDGTVAVLYEGCDGRPLVAPNDVVFDRQGGFWFTDHGVRVATGDDRPGVLYGLADGSGIRGVITGIDEANGIGLSPDGSVLYVAETTRGRLLAFDVTAPGEVARPDRPRVLLDVGGAAMFDSLAVDSSGAVCVATLLTGGITVVSADGVTVEFLATGDPLTTNIAFGAADLGTAHITCSGTGRLVSCPWPVPGSELSYRS